jgi:preprotein translocase subunit SecF
VNLLGIKIGMAGIAAFLMLIGYSVDTDILLTTRVLKRTEGTVIDRVYGSIKTGMMMSVTPLVAALISIFLIHSSDVRQIMIILLIGLFVDMIYTWIQNVGILRIYVEKRKSKGMTH